MKNKGSKVQKNPERLEKLALQFGKKFDLIDIVGDFVYGYISSKKEYLGTKAEYHEYRELKSANHSKRKKSKEESEKNKARKSYLETRDF